MTENKSIDARVQMTSEKEKDILTGVFKGNEHLLKVLRMRLYGLDIPQQDKVLIKNTFSKPEVKKAFRKKLFPIFEEDIPEIHVNSLADFWYGSEMNIIGQNRDVIYQTIQSKIKLKELFSIGISLLEDTEKELDLSFNYSPVDELATSLIARNLYIKSVNEAINIIKIFSEQEAKSPETVEKSLKKNSNK